MGRGLAGETEGMTGGMAALLHRGRSQRGKSHHVADGVNMRHRGLKISVHFQPAALVGRYADLLQPWVLGGADAARRIHQ